jgi:hypothetical protein
MNNSEPREEQSQHEYQAGRNAALDMIESGKKELLRSLVLQQRTTRTEEGMELRNSETCPPAADYMQGFRSVSNEHFAIHWREYDLSCVRDTGNLLEDELSDMQKQAAMMPAPLVQVQQSDISVRIPTQPDGGAAVRRAGFIFDSRNAPKGKMGDVLREIEIEDPDGLQILNLRKEKTKNGKPPSWDKIAERFEREGKPGHRYTGERVRQIYNKIMKKYPLLANIVEGSTSKSDMIENEHESDEDAIRSMTGKTAFDTRDLTDTEHNRALRTDTGITTTNNPRKPGYLANRKTR